MDSYWVDQINIIRKNIQMSEEGSAINTRYKYELDFCNQHRDRQANLTAIASEARRSPDFYKGFYEGATHAL